MALWRICRVGSLNYRTHLSRIAPEAICGFPLWLLVVCGRHFDPLPPFTRHLSSSIGGEWAGLCGACGASTFSSSLGELLVHGDFVARSSLKATRNKAKDAEAVRIDSAMYVGISSHSVTAAINLSLMFIFSLI